MTKAVRQDALADTMSWFPFFANIFRLLMPGTIRDLIQDTKTLEAHTMALIDRYATGYSAKPSQVKFTGQKSERSWQYAGLSDTYTERPGHEQSEQRASDFV